MRQERTVQSSVFDLFAGHEIGCELKAMSQWLDEHRELLSLVTRDLRRHGLKETGREGLPAEAVARCARRSSSIAGDPGPLLVSDQHPELQPEHGSHRALQRQHGATCGTHCSLPCP